MEHFKNGLGSQAKTSFLRFWRENRSLLLFISLMLVFRSAVADWNDVPTGSMEPTILPGDRIHVDKMAYDIRVPFTTHSIIKLADPKVGEIIVFESELAGKRLIKRVIGVPGDSVAMVDNQLIVNGIPLHYADTTVADGTTKAASTKTYVEHLPSSKHLIQLEGMTSPVANFAPVTVPNGHYLVLGDNRNRSADSRMIGFVPRGEIIGRSGHVVLSLDYDNYYLPRSDRYLQKLDPSA